MYLCKKNIMLPALEKIKGVPPSAILKRELKLQEIKSSDLAKSVGEHKQTISAVLNQRRKINPNLSIKLARYFDIEEDYFLLLQASYDIKEILSSQEKQTPNLNNIREVIFWDTTFDKIDWQRYRTSIIKRILERGNDTEIKEIISFYGKETITDEIKKMSKSRFPSFKKNIVKYNLA